MKLLFIEARKQIKLNEETKNKIAELPSPINIYYTVQYSDYASQVKKYLENKNKKIKQFKQVLGCSKLEIKDKKPDILYIGSGLFHIYSIVKQIDKKADIYILNIGKLRNLDREELGKINNKKKVSLSRFYSAEQIGILVSCKPGQEHLDKAMILKQKLERKDKKAYIFVADNININELENFSLDSWLNTACPGLALDSAKIVNAEDLRI